MTLAGPADEARGQKGQAPSVHVVCSLFHPSQALLDRQLESILDQTHAGLRVWLRDDAVSTETSKTIDAWHRRDPRIEPAPGAAERLGTPASYGALLRTALDAGADWIALADQDDEWRPTHLKDSLAAAARVAASDEPVLVHGDLELIDAEGRCIAPSFFAQQRIHHERRHPLRVLAVQNFVTGCATVVNRPLAEWALPVPTEAIMHDWWLALCAAASGHLVVRDATTVRYRQHDRNQIGATPYGEVLRELGQRTIRLKRHSAQPVIDTVEQVTALRRRIAERAADAAPPPPALLARTAAAAGLLDRYTALFRPGVSRWRRAFGLAQLGIGRQDALLDLSLKAKLLTTSVEVEVEPEP